MPKVRKPAGFLRISRLSPITAPQPSATASRIAISATGSTGSGGKAIECSSAPEQHRQREERVLEADQLERLARFGRFQLRGHRHGAEDLALDDEVVAVALDRRHGHQLLVVGTVEL